MKPGWLEPEEVTPGEVLRKRYWIVPVSLHKGTSGGAGGTTSLGSEGWIDSRPAGRQICCTLRCPLLFSVHRSTSAQGANKAGEAPAQPLKVDAETPSRRLKGEGSESTGNIWCFRTRSQCDSFSFLRHDPKRASASDPLVAAHSATLVLPILIPPWACHHRL